MRIAQVSTLEERVPPRKYGGTERVVAYLTEELVRQGHDVTLLASGDSQTAARLIPICDQSLRECGRCSELVAMHALALQEAIDQSQQGNFDILHLHLDYLHFPTLRGRGIPNITTLHNRIDVPGPHRMLARFPDIPVVTISDCQRDLGPPTMGWADTIYHGLPLNLYQLDPAPQDYAAFLGRMSPGKRVDRAIEIAGRVGMPIKIASKIDDSDRDYFKREIEPLLDQADVEFVGEVSDAEKQEFLGKARVLLFPIDWPEPFGLVMIEAMACGTPTVAFCSGAVPEVIDPGISGFVCNDIDSAVRYTEQALGLSREQCRLNFEKRFSVSRMAADYLRVYENTIEATDQYAEAGPRSRSHTHRPGHIASG